MVINLHLVIVLLWVRFHTNSHRTFEKLTFFLDLILIQLSKGGGDIFKGIKSIFRRRYIAKLYSTWCIFKAETAYLLITLHT